MLTFFFFSKEMNEHWNTGIQRSLLCSSNTKSSLDCFDSQKVYREADGAVCYDQPVDECKSGESDNTEYWSGEMKMDFVSVPRWSIEKCFSVLAKCGGQKKRFQYLVNPNFFQKSCAVEQSDDIQVVQSTLHFKTMCCYQNVSPRKIITSEAEKNWGQ